MSGSKGGGRTTKTEIPEYIEDAAKSNLALADKISNIGYTPYYGADVAAFTPMQDAAFQNTQDAASAFGMNTGAGQYAPEPTEFAGGVIADVIAVTLDQAQHGQHRNADQPEQILRGHQSNRRNNPPDNQLVENRQKQQIERQNCRRLGVVPSR